MTAPTLELERPPPVPGQIRPLLDSELSYLRDRRLLLLETKLLAEQGLPRGRVDALRAELAGLPEHLEPEVFRERWTALDQLSRALVAAEPTELEAIRASRPPAGPKLPPLRLSDADLRARIEAAWIGRAAGCLLGKPVEGWPRAKIEAYLRDAATVARYGPLDPLSFYIPADEELHARWRFHPSFRVAERNSIAGAMPRDDDMDYPVLALVTLERAGASFTSAEIARTWKLTLPYEQTYTAERIAYANLVGGLEPPETGAYANPYREWIGAQIRADFFGYIHPGLPERAAEMAWRDAVVSHTGNGVYGEMFFAALIAAAFTATSLDEALDAAVAQVPARSRFAEMVATVRGWTREGLDWNACWTRIDEAYGDLHWVHTLNNAALAIAALLHAGDDFERAITLTVLSGYDTDSNGATVGSVFGALHGPAAVPAKWTAPFDGKLRSAVFGHSEVRFRDLVDRAMEFVQRDGAGAS